MEDFLKDAASSTPDPERALNNLRSFCENNPDRVPELEANIRPVSLLFSISQFLANFSSSHPDVLSDSLGMLHTPVTKEALALSLTKELQGVPQAPVETLMGIFRIFKKKMLLLLTLRDILAVTDTVDSMSELSLLADVILEESVRMLRDRMKETYGEPKKDDAFAVISVGKLGGSELNYSSDVDLLYVYGPEGGETSGVMTSGGTVKNRISNHEYYCKLGEQLNRFLSMSTEEGFAYRVDLRLRPEGQRGSLAQSLAAYEIYYESWGMAWERAVLLRARPVAGDTRLGEAFTETIMPFIYRKYLDFSAIDEIRRMKTRIDAAFKRDDIKRGYGGIREIEFFVQALQLIYGGKEPMLREKSILMGLHRLLQKNLIGHEDFSVLNENYLFLRRLEHRLQQLNDLQTHSLPLEKSEVAILGRKMGYGDGASFSADVERRRSMVRDIYGSLFKGTEEKTVETSLFFSEDLSVSELKEALTAYPLQDRDRAAKNIIHIKDSMLSFQTLRGRRLLGDILPSFLHEALKTKNPDMAIHNLQSFAALLASEESYLESFKKNEGLIPALARMFSWSEYLLKQIMKRPEYLELIGHEMFLKKTLSSVKAELRETLASGTPLPDAIRMLRQMEEIRLGTLFLDKKIDVVRLVKGLSKAAEAIVSVCTDELVRNGFAAVGMGKAGGREITFDSDLDLIFLCDKEITDTHTKAAERLIRLLTSHTKDGIAYKVDMRLRPDGTRGPLVKTVDALSRYYAGAARSWEFQALLKARLLGGDRLTGCSFMEMRESALKEKGKEVASADIKGMRVRILKELAREREGYDIKLGPGGIEELEFTVQYLQLKHCGREEGLIPQGTLDALRQLVKAGVIETREEEYLRDSYLFYRTLESFLRLRGEPVLRKAGVITDDSAQFLGLQNGSALLKEIEEKRDSVRRLFGKYLG